MGKVEVKTRGTRAESRDSGRGSRGSGEEEVPRELVKVGSRCLVIPTVPSSF